MATLLPLISTACSAPPVRISAEPPETVMFLDGRVAPAPAGDTDGGEAARLLPFGYYGTIVADGLPPATPHECPWLPGRIRVERPEPVTPWIFPFDFPVELAQRAFSAPEVRSAVVRLRENPVTVVPGFVPASLEGLGERARLARTSR